MRENYTLKRLYCDMRLSSESKISLPKEQVHYLLNVLRMTDGDSLRLFNGCDGEWLGEIDSLSKKRGDVRIKTQLRPSYAVPDIRLAFAPVRRHRTAFIFEKATELGVAQFEPVITARTQFPKLNLDKARAQIIEAAEQTERLDIPTLIKPMKLLDWIAGQSARPIIFADEAGDAIPAKDALREFPAPATILIGPEGGFTPEERTALRDHVNVTPVSLGPRILRADTAALSLLTLWQALQGDWNASPV